MSVNYSQWQPSPPSGHSHVHLDVQSSCPHSLTLSPSDADFHMNFTADAARELRSKSHESQMTQPSPPEIPFASLSPLQCVA